MKLEKTEVLVAREGFVADVGGVRRVIRKGDIVDAADAVIRGRRHLFITAAERLASRGGVAV